MKNYDKFKLSNPVDDGYGYELVSSCCGAEFWDSSEWEETEENYICDACDEGCELIEDYEYEAIQKENYLEAREDARREERN